MKTNVTKKIATCLMFLFVILLCSSQLNKDSSVFNNTLSLNSGKVYNHSNYLIQSVHPNLNFLDWVQKDESYLLNLSNNFKNKQVTTDIIQNEISIINKEILKLKGSYELTKSGAKLYSPEITGSLHVLYSGLNAREIFLVNLSKNKSTLLKSYPYNYIWGDKKLEDDKCIDYKDMPTNKHISSLYQSAKEVLNDDIYKSETLNTLCSNRLLKNADIYIFPFKSKSFIARTKFIETSITNPEIILATDLYNKYDKNLISSYKRVIYHEIGHIFSINIAYNEYQNKHNIIRGHNINNSLIMNDYKTNIGVSNLNGYRLSESISEDFSFYIMKELNEFNIRKRSVAIDYNHSGFSKFMDKYTLIYKQPNINKLNFNIKTNEEKYTNKYLYDKLNSHSNIFIYNKRPNINILASNLPKMDKVNISLYNGIIPVFKNKKLSNNQAFDLKPNKKYTLYICINYKKIDVILAQYDIYTK
jgi:hypothetical protein